MTPLTIEQRFAALAIELADLKHDNLLLEANLAQVQADLRDTKAELATIAEKRTRRKTVTPDT